MRQTSYKHFILLTLFMFFTRSAFVFAQLSPEIELQIQQAMEEGDIPGLSLVILKDSQQIIKSYGYANLGKKKKVTSKTLFEIGSCSKAFTALAVTKLVEEGSIDLNAKVSSYLPWFNVYYKNKKVEITVEQLLHHTSGFPFSTISKIPESNSVDALEQTVRKLIGQELSDFPGDYFEYATINYDVLALIIQKRTGKPFEEYLQKEIIDPLHLNYTSIGKPKYSDLMSTGYKISFYKAREYIAPVFKGNNAAGYVISNAEDMASWLNFQMGNSNSNLYPLAMSTHQRDESVPLHNMSSYAKGWEVTLDGTNEIFHGGLNPNFTSYVAFRPDEKLGVILLANSNSSFTGVLANNIMTLISGEKIENEIDPGDGNDTTFSTLTIFMSFYLLVLVAFFILTIVRIFQKKRQYEKLSLSKVSKYLFSICAILPFIYGIYIFPKALAGFNWESILVWTPVSLKFFISLILLAIAGTFIANFLSMCFPETSKYKQIAPKILLISILSGLSNVFLIVLISASIGSDIELKYMVFYYVLLLVVYLFGRRYVEISLIKFTRNLVYDLKVQLIDKIFSTSYQNFEGIERGRIYTALNDDVEVLGSSANSFVSLITSVITIIGAFLYLASIAFWATIITIFLIISLAGIYYYVTETTNVFFEEARDEKDTYMSYLNGMIDGFKEISLHRNKKIEYKNDVSKSAYRFKDKISTADIRFVNAFLLGESLLVMLLGLVAFGIPKLFPNIESYTVMSFVVLLLYLIGPINGVLGEIPGFLYLKISWNRIQKFIKEIPATLDLSIIPKPKDSLVKSFEAEGITFQYLDEDNAPSFAVGPVDLKIKSGEILFIIGGNGSGKTTLAKMLVGLFEKTNGRLLINNKEVTNSELSEYFSVVFNPSYLFKKLYCIDNNQYKNKEIEKYLKIFELSDKVEIKDNEYSTINLSSGQRKRLALLQCYLEDSPIYLFDEWAADQDPNFRNFFYRTLLPEMKKAGKIIIAITHDDHYFDIADKVIKMDHGKLKPFNIGQPAHNQLF